MAVRGSMLSVLTRGGWLSEKTEKRKSGVHQGYVSGLQLFILYTAVLFPIRENKPYGYADDSTLVAVVPSLVRE